MNNNDGNGCIIGSAVFILCFWAFLLGTFVGENDTLNRVNNNIKACGNGNATECREAVENNEGDFREHLKKLYKQKTGKNLEY